MSRLVAEPTHTTLTHRQYLLLFLSRRTSSPLHPAHNPLFTPPVSTYGADYSSSNVSNPPHNCYICTSHTRQETYFCPCCPQQQTHAQPKSAIALLHLPIILPPPDRSTHFSYPPTHCPLTLVSGACTCLLDRLHLRDSTCRQAPSGQSSPRIAQHQRASHASLQNSQLCTALQSWRDWPGSRSGGTCSRVLATSGFPSCLSVL